MSPVEKANELVDKYYPIFDNTMSLYLAKKCASIAVDEILEMDLPILEEDADTFYDYWEEVKQEINNI